MPVLLPNAAARFTMTFVTDPTLLSIYSFEMPLAQFLSTLFEDGRVVVPELHDLSNDDLAHGTDVLEKYMRVQRETFPGTPPEFDSPVGLWAATRLYRACQFAIYRDLGPEAIVQEIGELPAFPRTAPAHFNVDMTFRYLPDLHHFARTAAEDDPLVTILNGWAHDWPLSSVGMSNVDPVSIDEFAGDDSLMQCYVVQFGTTVVRRS